MKPGKGSGPGGRLSDVSRIFKAGFPSRPGGGAVLQGMKGRMGALLAAVAVIVALAGFKGTFFTVDPEEQALVLRFGKHVRTVDPGLHFKLPFGIERVFRVPVQRLLKLEFGFRTMKAEIRSEYEKQGYDSESLMLTGGLNSADVEWIVQYRISDPEKYMFNLRDVTKTFRDMNEAAMREIVGDRSVDEVITWGKEEINMEVQKKLQELCAQYEMGITIQMVMLQDVNAPPPVQPSWNEVNSAEQEKDKLINEAKSKYNTEVPKAKGEADRKISEAEGYAIERVNMALGESANFNQVLEAYQKAPAVTRKRIYLETMNTIMPLIGRKVVADEDENGILRFLDLSAKTAGGGQ